MIKFILKYRRPVTWLLGHLSGLVALKRPQTLSFVRSHSVRQRHRVSLCCQRFFTFPIHCFTVSVKTCRYFASDITWLRSRSFRLGFGGPLTRPVGPLAGGGSNRPRPSPGFGGFEPATPFGSLGAGSILASPLLYLRLYLPGRLWSWNPRHLVLVCPANRERATIAKVQER
jgi:hypothetical protein